MKERRIWKTVSYLLHPLFMPTVGICFILVAEPSLLFSISPMSLVMIPWTILGCTAFLPLFCIVSLLKAGKITNIENPVQHDRFLIMVVTQFGFLSSFLALHYIPAGGNPITLFLLGINIALAITIGINFFTRTSLHTTGTGGLLGAVIGMEYYSRINLNYWIGVAVLLAFIAGYARFKLKAHNTQELYMGYLIGILSLSLVFIITSHH